MNNIFEIQNSLKESEPKNGSFWVHYLGGVYKILLKAVQANEPHDIKVIYQNTVTNEIWEHPLIEWQKKVELEDGSIVDRFQPYYNHEKLEEQWDC